MPPIQVSPPPGKAIASDIWSYATRHPTGVFKVLTDAGPYTVSGSTDTVVSSFTINLPPKACLVLAVKFEFDGYTGSSSNPGTVWLEINGVSPSDLSVSVSATTATHYRAFTTFVDLIDGSSTSSIAVNVHVKQISTSYPTTVENIKVTILIMVVDPE